MTIKKDLMGEPEMPVIEGSEIEGVVDTTAIGLDRICRPILFNQDGREYMELTVEDAKRLLEFLNEAVPFVEQQQSIILKQ